MTKPTLTAEERKRLLVLLRGDTIAGDVFAAVESILAKRDATRAQSGTSETLIASPVGDATRLPVPASPTPDHYTGSRLWDATFTPAPEVAALAQALSVTTPFTTPFQPETTPFPVRHEVPAAPGPTVRDVEEVYGVRARAPAELYARWLAASRNLRASAASEPTMADRTISESHLRRRAVEALAAGDALLAALEARPSVPLSSRPKCVEAGAMVIRDGVEPGGGWGIYADLFRVALRAAERAARPEAGK